MIVLIVLDSVTDVMDFTNVVLEFVTCNSQKRDQENHVWKANSDAANFFLNIIQNC